MIALQKITEAEMDANGVCAAPNVLNGTVAQNKAVFDKMVRQLIAPAYNAAVDAIDAINAAETGIEAEEVLRVAAEGGRVDAEQGRTDAEADRVAAESARVAAEGQRAAAETAREDAETSYVAQAAASAVAAAASAAEAAQIVGGDYATKVSGAVAGNLAGLNVSGNLVDSGKKPQDFAGAADMEAALAGKAAATHTHTPAQIGAATTATLTALIPASPWTASGGFYSQQVSVPGMLETDNPIMDVMMFEDNAANKLVAEAWSKVLVIFTSDNLVKIWCTEVPTVGFYILFRVVR